MRWIYVWNKLAERMEEEVLDKYKVEESKREAFLEWRRVRGKKMLKSRKWSEYCRARIFSLISEYN